MADPDDIRSYRVGYAKPPREMRFRPGQSGNARGRPKGAKNFATADSIRKHLSAIGITLEDRADGTIWRKEQ